MKRHGVDDFERSINSWDDDIFASTQSLDRDHKLPYPEHSSDCNHKPNPSHRHHMHHSGSFLSLDQYYSPDEACSFKSDQYKAKVLFIIISSYFIPNFKSSSA